MSGIDLRAMRGLQKKIEQLQFLLLDREEKITSLVLTHQTKSISFEKEITTLAQSLKSVTFQRDLYKEQLVAKTRALFAAKSEARRNPAQGELFFNEAEQGEGEETETETAESTKITVTAHS